MTRSDKEVPFAQAPFFCTRMKERNHASAVLEIDGIILPVKPDQEHEWTLSTEQVAIGYGVSTSAIRKHKARNADELVEGTHFTSDTNCVSGRLRVD